MTDDLSSDDRGSPQWHVELPEGVSVMTARELDDALRSGTVSPRTMVMRSGAFQWRSLKSVLPLSLHEQSVMPVATDLAAPVLPGPPPLPAQLDFSFAGKEGGEKGELRLRRAILSALLLSVLLGVSFAGWEMLGSRAGASAMGAAQPAPPSTETSLAVQGAPPPAEDVLPPPRESARRDAPAPSLRR